MSYVETAIAEAVAAADAQETKVEATPAAPETEQVEAAEIEETATEDYSSFNRKRNQGW